MRVALGTFEVTDEERKAIKRAIGFKSGRASRDEVREFVIAAAERAVRIACEPDPEDLIRAREERES